MKLCHALAAALGAAAFFPLSAASGALDPDSVNLHRARVLLGGDARAIWVGDSWVQLQHQGRTPYGALLVWPVGRLTAISTSLREGGLGNFQDFTSGDGRLELVTDDTSWEVDFDPTEGQQHFALPVFDLTQVRGDDQLVLDTEWQDMPRIQSHVISNARISLGDLPEFSREGDSVKARVLYYATRSTDTLAQSIRLADRDGTRLDAYDLHTHARPLWHQGQDPRVDPPREPALSQVNALATDVRVNAGFRQGAGVTMGEDPEAPLIGSGRYWITAGGVYYHTDQAGEPAPGFYHAGLGSPSWSFLGLGEDTPSAGGKNFTDEQLVHWIDVTTLRREQVPVVILHVATEDKEPALIEERVRRIIERFRWAFAEVGTAPVRFLLVGSYMHEIRERSLDTSAQRILELDAIYASLAETEPDCAFVSLYRLTDGTFLSTDAYGGEGTQEASRQWLDANGWSTITFGGVTYPLSSADGGGLNGAILPDGLHTNDPEGAAFIAKLISDAILASRCPGDFDGNDALDSRDLIAFLNAWTALDPSADLDDNSVIDSRDVIAFLNVWNEPC